MRGRVPEKLYVVVSLLLLELCISYRYMLF